MQREIIRVLGKGVGAQVAVLRDKLFEYQGVTGVRTRVVSADEVKLTVEYDLTAAGEFDDSAAFILEKYAGLRNVRAEWIERPKLALTSYVADVEDTEPV
jgi:hypothetical protein